ncbi:hypothetical protein BDY24DRAFT_373156 [Mrakia frigida]|uniref:GMC family oxidoreductase n=1 Tax=Mrakia frigida TaxID=29902 RepID=UPI003FCBF1E5
MPSSLPIHPLSKLGHPDPAQATGGKFEYDFIICGGGTAGCVLASRLSLLPSKPKVLLLERGSSLHKGWVSGVPLLSTAWQSDKAKSYAIQTVPQAGLKGKKVTFAGGKMIGGTSRINSSLYTRGLPSEFNAWSTKHDLPSWSYSAVMPYFAISQTHLPLPSVLPPTVTPHSSTPALPASLGHSGPWKTSTPRAINHPPVVPFIQAAQSIGIPLVSSLNDPECSASAVAVHDLTGDQGRRGSTGEFLWGDSKTSGFGEGLKVGIGAVVKRVEVDNKGNVTGVWFGEDDGKADSSGYFASSKKEVIISSGTIVSPQILLLSGIGPRAELEALGIDVKVDLPGVGKGLADHLGVYLPYSVPYTDSLDRIETSPLHAMGQLASFITSRSGAFTFQGSQACIMTSSSHVPALLAGDSPYSKDHPLWTSSRDENEIPDLEILPLPLRYHCSLDDGKPDGTTPDLLKGKYDKSKGYFTPIVVLVTPKSNGSVTLKSKNVFDEPVCDPAFLSHPDDVKVLVKGLKLARKIVENMKASGYPVEPHGKFFPWKEGTETTDEDLEDYARTWGSPCYHQSSTLRLSSPSEPLGVLDERLRVRGTKGLRVADASVFPEVLAAHTQAAVVMVAEKCAAMVAEDWKVEEGEVKV